MPSPSVRSTGVPEDPEASYHPLGSTEEQGLGWQPRVNQLWNELPSTRRVQVIGVQSLKLASFFVMLQTMFQQQEPDDNQAWSFLDEIPKWVGFLLGAGLEIGTSASKEHFHLDSSDRNNLTAGLFLLSEFIVMSGEIFIDGTDAITFSEKEKSTKAFATIFIGLTAFFLAHGYDKWKQRFDGLPTTVHAHTSESGHEAERLMKAFYSLYMPGMLIAQQARYTCQSGVESNPHLPWFVATAVVLGLSKILDSRSELVHSARDTFNKYLPELFIAVLSWDQLNNFMNGMFDRAEPQADCQSIAWAIGDLAVMATVFLVAARVIYQQNQQTSPAPHDGGLQLSLLGEGPVDSTVSPVTGRSSNSTYTPPLEALDAPAAENTTGVVEPGPGGTYDISDTDLLAAPQGSQQPEQSSGATPSQNEAARARSQSVGPPVEAEPTKQRRNSA